MPMIPLKDMTDMQLREMLWRTEQAKKEEEMSTLNGILDDLTDRQLRDLLWWLWINRYTVTRTNIAGWRRDHGVPKGD